MLFLPILLSLGIIGIAVLSKSGPAKPRIMTSQPPPSVIPAAAHPALRAIIAKGVVSGASDAHPAFNPLAMLVSGDSISPYDLLCQAVEMGLEIPTELVVAALAEAAECGDTDTFREILVAFPPPTPIALQKQSEPDTVVGKASLPASPIRGVTDPQWAEFVAKLRTQDVSYRDDRHVGAFHHNVKRLSDLGIDPSSLTDETSQYQAIETDLKTINEQSRKLINEWCGDVITINGISTPITHSGLLGIIKSAGVEGAKQWLTSEESRIKYPNTTKQFLNTNGLF